MKFTNNQSAQAAAQAIDMRGEFLSQREVSLNAGELRALLIDMGFKVAPTKKAVPRTDSEFKTNGARKATAAEPLRNHEDFQRLATYLRNNGRYGRRNYMLLVLGVTLGLRCGDLLRLRVGDVYSCDTKRVRAAVTLIEEKTNKRTRNVITPAAAAAIADYIAGAKEVRETDPLFCSSHKDRRGNKQPLTITMAWRILNEGAAALGIESHVSTHTLRKTYGYAANKSMVEAGLPAALVMETLQAKYRHSSQDITMRYLGLEQDNIDGVAALVGEWIAGGDTVSCHE